MYVTRGCLLIALIGTACSDASSKPPAETASGEPLLPPQHFETVGTITLQESDDVINVAPFVAPRPRADGFVVVDQREARARLYGLDGRLVRQFGRKGRGPGEFQRPIAGYELPSGRLVVADIANGLMHFETPDSLLSSSTPEVRPLYGARPLSDSLVLLAGRGVARASERAPLLHVWDLSRGAPILSFFPTPGDSVQRIAARNFGWAGTDVRGDTIAAVFSLSDSLYLFHTSGRALRAIPLRLRGFQPIRELPGAAADDPVKLGRWLEQFIFLNSVFILPDGSFLVQSEQQRGAGSTWNLLHIGPQGEHLWDLRNTPRLVAVQRGHLYFLDPASETPNQWLVARLRG